MLTFYPDKKASLPIYRQLYHYVKKQIQTGELKTFEKMPSKRELATHLKLSPVTVDSAYQQLVVEGYLKAKPKSGFFVEPYDQLLMIDQETVKMNLSESKKPKYEFAFQTNVIDDSLFPHALWGKLARETLAAKKVGINSFEKQGIWELREEIAKYLKSFRGISCEPEQIIVGAGTESLLAILIPLIGTTSHYAMENPGYPKISQIFNNWQMHFSYVNLDHQGLKVDELSNKQIDVIHVTPSHQFPMGIVMPLQRRLELLNWAKQSDEHFIIEDDYDSEFRYVGKPIPALQSLDQFGKVIYMNSFSKSLAPSLRVSYMVVPKLLLQKFTDNFNYHNCSVSYFDQWVLTKFMQGGHFERHLNQMRKVYKTRLDLFTKLFHELSFSSMFTLQGTEAGLHFLMVAKDASEKQLTTLAKQKGILLRGLNEFSFKGINHYPSTLVIGYSGLNEEKIKQALEKLTIIWASNLTRKNNMVK